MARARNNITKLTVETRLRICELLDDGAEYNDIREDSVIAEECGEKGLTLHNTTFLAYRESVEFDEYRKRRRKFEGPKIRRHFAAAMVGTEGIQDQADLAAYLLNEQALKKIEAGEILDPKDYASMARAIKTISERGFAKKEAEYLSKLSDKDSRIAELTATVAELTEQLTGQRNRSVDPTAVQNQLDNLLGLKK
jgi:hypothetical protein